MTRPSPHAERQFISPLMDNPAPRVMVRPPREMVTHLDAQGCITPRSSDRLVAGDH